MAKIAFIDVDMTLVDNHTSQYNDNLLVFIANGGFDQVYLVTGRNTNDFWQHVLHMGAKPERWRDQLLFNVVSNLRANGINVMGVSTPYDHYLHEQRGRGPFAIDKAGDAAELFYMPFERKIARYQDSDITQQLLVNEFSNMTGSNRYVATPGGNPNEDLIQALQMYLIVTDDTEKRGQFNFLLERVLEENNDDLDVFFFDDKPENIETSIEIFSTHNRVSSFHTMVVDKVNDCEISLDEGNCYQFRGPSR